MSRANGRPEAEVIVNVRTSSNRWQRQLLTPFAQYNDGFAYSKHKMEEAFRTGGFLEKQLTAKPPVQYPKDLVKKEDVELLVRPRSFPAGVAIDFDTDVTSADTRV